MKKLLNINSAKEYVRDKADLFKLISNDVSDREWKEENNVHVTYSPFREESKPSFKISGNRFKDWGGEQHGGDIFYWVQLWHGLKFEESILYVANYFNIDITQYLRNPTPEELQLSHYKQLNKLAAEWAHQCLRNNSIIRDDYLSKSRFTLDMIEPYLIGYVPTIEALITYLSGITQLTENDVNKLQFDRRYLFTNALTYPVHDHNGDVLYFYTRQLEPEAPYKSMTNEHPMFDPGIIYGLHVAKRKFRTNGAKLVLVEGQRDAIALGAGGILGSELRDQQLDTIKEFKIKEVIICYDNDSTGWKKSLDLINKPRDFGDILLTITSPPDIDTDPHDVWKQGGDGAIYNMLSKSVTPLEYYINHGNFNLNSLTDKHRLLVSLKDYLTNITGIHLSISISYLSSILNSTVESINDYVAEVKAAYSQLYNIEAEKTLIFNCMKVSASFNAARSAGIIDESFTYSKYKKIFAGCRIAFDKYGNNYTPQVILDEAMAKYMDPDLPNVVKNIFESEHKYSESVACEIVLDMYRRRRASEQASELISASRDLSISFIEIVNNHRKHLISSVSSSRQQARTPKELSIEFYNELKYREKLGGNLIIGYDFFALPSINMILGGIQPGHLIVLAGDTGAGKSILAMNIVNCLAVANKVKVLWIGQEMQSIENTMRLASMISGVNNTKIQAGRIDQKEAIALSRATETIENSGLYMAQPREGTIDEILAIIDEYRWKYGIEAVVWDYIGMVSQSVDQYRWSREQIIGNASTIIKTRVTVDMGIPAIILAQMNRDKQAEGKQKISGAYRIIQDSDDFLWIEEKTKKQMIEDGVANGNRYIRIGKRRGGLSTFVANAYLDTDPRTCTLRISENTTPSQRSKLYSELIA